MSGRGEDVPKTVETFSFNLSVIKYQYIINIYKSNT